ncbi:MAG: ABC transporter substrate-binding protein [Deltaproteobacteria bacterium]|jgi:branched-chain amino acid transport system substrate-binding protein|nr:ABC transporter substrate-binding protein [Deltaproteobacteria bacterium]MDO8956917.1 ABC transporter substrate-binding protein [Deltaproteobacteria bacterium]MDO9209461.1 ABC transporter substrate-binding protein [Deltaproteobacteria bacterium]
MKKCLPVVCLFLTFCVAGGLAWAADPIKLGAFFDLTGAGSAIGTPTKLVAEMVVKKINGEGGINGRPLQLVIADDEGDPTKAAIIAKKFIESDKVVAIIGPTRTDTGMAAKPIIEQMKVPTFMCVGGDPVVTVPPFKWTFKSPQRTSVAVKKTYDYLKRKGIQNIAIITSADGFGRDGKNWLEKLAVEYGLKIITGESFQATDNDMTTQLIKIKAASPEAIICWTIGKAGSIVAKNVKQLGIQVPLFQCHGLPDPIYIKLAGEASEGNIMPATKLMVASQLPNSDPQKKVILEFIRLYKDVYQYERQFPINTHSGYAWDAIYILANAMKKAGTNNEKLREAIEKTKGYIGVSGIYNLTPEDHNGLGLDSMVIVQIVKGEWKMLE